MSGMGKPGNDQTWVYGQATDQWFGTSVTGSGGGGSSGPVTGTWRDPGNTFVTTGSVSVDSQNRTAAQVGTDVFFYVSGTTRVTSGGARQVSVFGGDIVASASVLATSFTASGGSVMGSQAFNWMSGTQTFTVPAGITSITAKVWGAGGGAGDYANDGGGGGGGFAEATIVVTPGEQLIIIVGGGGQAPSSSLSPGGVGGYGGGGNGAGTAGGASGGGGGGLSGIFSGSYTQAGAYLIAGGGGGADGYNNNYGGAGGGLVGGDGNHVNPYGHGGTQSAGGADGVGTTTPPTAGYALQGGTDSGVSSDSGGGGGGWFGGGAGTYDSGGGGGGSGYGLTGSVVSNITLTQAPASPGGGAAALPANSTDPNYLSGSGMGGSPGTNGGNGYVFISWATGDTGVFDGDSLRFTSNASGNSASVYFDGSDLRMYDPHTVGGSYTLSALISGSIGSGTFVSRGVYAARPAAGIVGRLYIATDYPFMYFDDGTQWNQHGPVYNLPAVGPTGSWNGPNFNVGSTETSSSFGDAIYFQTTASDSDLHTWMKGALATGTGGTWRVTLGMNWLPSADDSYPAAGISLYDSSTGKFITLFMYMNGNPLVEIGYWSTSTSRASQTGDFTFFPPLNSGIQWLQVYFDGTNLNYLYSTDGVDFYRWHQDTPTLYCNPDHFGVMVSNFSGGSTFSALTCLTLVNATQ